MKYNSSNMVELLIRVLCTQVELSRVETPFLYTDLYIVKVMESSANMCKRPEGYCSILVEIWYIEQIKCM